MDALYAQLNHIKNKLDLLRNKDRQLKIFGANRHKYTLNKCLNLKKIMAFENENKCILPQGYKLFLIHIGNGGAGPNYGLEPLENSLFDDLDYKRGELLNPGRPFPYENNWNLSFRPKHSIEENDELYYEELEEFENLYFNPEHINGSIRISNLGCGTYENLVVSGSEKGNIWVDCRASDGGIYPNLKNNQRINFLDWYELWLDKSLAELS
ncbi:SMI1/KNR4 family protein [Flavobacterium sp. RNTU_13]|uniref:SMI1/KNR4 family protein n=1 Tax=Flavobacterium sp. RNTU_13 TaxID=3375145 RepID=UPI003986B5BE